MSNHLWFDFHLVECLSIVHAHHGSDHLRHDDHVAQVRAHGIRSFAVRCLFFRDPELLDQGQRFPFESSLEPTPGSCREEFHQFVGSHVQQFFDLHATVREPLERPLLRCVRLHRSHARPSVRRSVTSGSDSFSPDVVPCAARVFSTSPRFLPFSFASTSFLSFFLRSPRVLSPVHSLSFPPFVQRTISIDASAFVSCFRVAKDAAADAPTRSFVPHDLALLPPPSRHTPVVQMHPLGIEGETRGEEGMPSTRQTHPRTPGETPGG
mmetsp:Transcript_2105/g.13683  ORF Transcript_2105/g.13683 Transcript_2105/m.13683 type:complete len:266 (-) Transcript_2105:33-830(-)